MNSRMKRSTLLVVASMFTLGACADQGPTEAPPARPQFNFAGEPALVFIKKFGPAGTYQFDLTATTGFLTLGPSPLISTSSGFAKVWEADDRAEEDAPFMLMEVLTGNMQVDSIWWTTIVRDAKGFLTEGPQFVVRGTNIAEFNVGYDLGAYVLVYNSEAPPGGRGEGCTPGYWKQPHHYDSWPAAYAPNQAFGSVFSNAFPGMTLLEVLKQGGGGLKALGRHTVAALLNAASTGVDSDLTVTDVISGFNAAFASGDYSTAHKKFAGFNEQNCPLN